MKLCIWRVVYIQSNGSLLNCTMGQNKSCLLRTACTDPEYDRPLKTSGLPTCTINFGVGFAHAKFT